MQHLVSSSIQPPARGLDKYSAPQWLGARAHRRFHVMAKPAGAAPPPQGTASPRRGGMTRRTARDVRRMRLRRACIGEEAAGQACSPRGIPPEDQQRRHGRREL